MSQAVTLYNIFIASPSDVTWARAQIRQTVHAWNKVHAKHSAHFQIFEGAGSRYSHAYDCARAR